MCVYVLLVRYLCCLLRLYPLGHPPLPHPCQLPPYISALLDSRSLVPTSVAHLRSCVSRGWGPVHVGHSLCLFCPCLALRPTQSVGLISASFVFFCFLYSLHVGGWTSAKLFSSQCSWFWLYQQAVLLWLVTELFLHGWFKDLVAE